MKQIILHMTRSLRVSVVRESKISINRLLSLILKTEHWSRCMDRRVVRSQLEKGPGASAVEEGAPQQAALAAFWAQWREKEVHAKVVGLRDAPNQFLVTSLRQ